MYILREWQGRLPPAQRPQPTAGPSSTPWQSSFISSFSRLPVFIETPSVSAVGYVAISTSDRGPILTRFTSLARLGRELMDKSLTRQVGWPTPGPLRPGDLLPLLSFGADAHCTLTWKGAMVLPATPSQAGLNSV